MSVTRRWARELTPPLFYRALRRHVRLRGMISFDGDYPDWPSAAALCTGYDDGAILEKVRAAALVVKRGEAVYERDSRLFDEIEYSWPLLASLLSVAAARADAPVRVVDFGGALGTTYYQNRRYLERLPAVQWRVVEQPHFVEAGRRDFTSAVLSFHESISEATRGGTDVVLLGGVLNYLEDPADVMRQILDAAPGHLILDRTIVIEGARDVIAIQTVPEAIYGARYPVRKLCRPSLNGLLQGWTVVEKWTCDLQPDPLSTSYGFFCASA